MPVPNNAAPQSETDAFTVPEGYTRIKIVGSFGELVNFPFGPEVNAICWQRELPGDFDELAALFRQEEDVTSLDEDLLRDLREDLSPAGRAAAEALLKDQRLLRDYGLKPSLECVPRYLRDEAAAIVPTDVYSFHADRATVKTDTYLCSYNEFATEGLRNEEAQRHIDLPATHTKLLKQFEQDGGGDFEEYLRENCYDLHYAPLPGAVPFSFGLGNLWRIAVEYPHCPVPPCLHRAPETVEGRLPRLLLIS